MQERQLQSEPLCSGYLKAWFAHNMSWLRYNLNQHVPYILSEQSGERFATCSQFLTLDLLSIIPQAKHKAWTDEKKIAVERGQRILRTIVTLALYERLYSHKAKWKSSDNFKEERLVYLYAKKNLMHVINNIQIHTEYNKMYLRSGAEDRTGAQQPVLLSLILDFWPCCWNSAGLRKQNNRIAITFH